MIYLLLVKTLFNTFPRVLSTRGPLFFQVFIYYNLGSRPDISFYSWRRSSL